ncbi:hypothetical protein KUCAC02_019761 [Chaenocephalus aceratus]|uniref:Uncharacterized protein n=1 Tax=Chaenocephalus aceratus TaxID=36190 RepID=A0ACB9VQ49_CHAAC|nr:hypothetical protein KUCAC02_019761 [Chaenocephalus aceratus]
MLLTARRLSKVLQLTLAVIKPDAVAHPVMLEWSDASVPFSQRGLPYVTGEKLMGPTKVVRADTSTRV